MRWVNKSGGFSFRTEYAKDKSIKEELIKNYIDLLIETGNFCRPIWA